MSLPKDRRLPSKKIKKVFAKSEKIYSKMVIARVHTNHEENLDSRFAISVSRRFGKSVSRNLFKRRVKQICLLADFPKQLDIVFTPTRLANSTNYNILKSSINSVSKRLRQISEKSDARQYVE